MNVGQNKALTTGKRRLPGIVTLLISLLVITPLCGFLFSCGCTWPGAGLAENCNYFEATAPHKCPWCLSSLAGSLSVGFAVSVGYLTAMTRGILGQYSISGLGQLACRIFSGLVLFCLAALVSGWLSAELQGYPFFLQGFFR